MNAAVSVFKSYSMARGVLAQCARVLPLPLAAQDEIATCLEWFKNVPATRRVLAELCNNPICEHELLVHAVAPDERIVLQWLCQEAARGRRMHLTLSVVWQQWIHTSPPWSVDLMSLTHDSQHVQALHMAGHTAELCPHSVETALKWAKRTWAAAVLGPCARCQTPLRKRLCLVTTRLCARCSLAVAIAG